MRNVRKFPRCLASHGKPSTIFSFFVVVVVVVLTTLGVCVYPHHHSHATPLQQQAN